MNPNNFEEQNKVSTLVYEISNALLKLNDLNKILDLSIKKTIEVMDAYTVSIALYSRNEEKLTIKKIIRADGIKHPISIKEFRLGEGVAGLAALKREILIVDDTTNSKIFVKKNKNNKNCTVIAVPMIIGDELIGVLNISYHSNIKFSKFYKEFLVVLSTIIAASIKNCQLYNKLNSQVNNLSRLFGITSTFSTKTKQNVKNIVKASLSLFDAEMAHLMLFNHNRLETFVKYSKNGELPPFDSVKLNEKSFTTKVFSTNQPLYTNDFNNHPDRFEKNAKSGIIKSLLTVPVSANDDCLGVLHIANKRELFNEEDVKLAQIIASHVGTKIENNLLLERTKSERDLLDKVVEHIDEGVIVVDKSGKVVIWNSYLENTLGINSKDVIGQQMYAICKKLGILEVCSEVTNAFTNDKKSISHYFEKEIETFSGQKSWFSISISVIDDINKNANEIVIVFRNITKEKELIIAKNEFISTSAHELRTPLTSIKGYLNMILSGDAGKLTPLQGQYFTKAYLSTERLVQLVEDLLDVLRIEENRLTLNIQSFRLNKIINEAVENLSAKSYSKKIVIKKNFSRESLIAFADPIKTKHMIENIVDNAIKYTRNKGEIKISAERNENQILVKIQDNGVGIKRHDLDIIFERFIRIDNPLSIKAGGTGLGLFIAKNIAEKQGGGITVESVYNKGTIFSITIPLAIK